jgi:DNA-binding FadR family transcriptional regulator
MSHLSHTISQSLEEEILCGERRPGERLPTEESLCSRFQASRTAVREAIQQLRGRGLVKTRKGSGSFIAQPNIEMLSDAVETFSVLNRGGSYLELIDFRLLLETECARLAATRASDEMMSLMQRALTKMRDSQGNRKRQGEADIAFHLAIAASSKHRLFASLLGALKKRSIEYASITPEGLENFEDMIATHDAIFQAIAQRNPEEAGNRMKNHLTRSRALYLQQTGQSFHPEN